MAQPFRVRAAQRLISAGWPYLPRISLFYDCTFLEGDLTPLGNLTFLHTLSLHGCSNLSGDLSPLAGLSSLQKLDLSFCWNLSGDLSPLTHLISLQKLSFHS